MNMIISPNNNSSSINKEEACDVQAQECALYLINLKHQSNVEPLDDDDEVDTTAVVSTSDSHSFYDCSRQHQHENLPLILPKSITKKDISYDSDGSSITKTPSLADEDDDGEHGEHDDQHHHYEHEQDPINHHEDISVEDLIGDSELIGTDDRELVPDALLVAMGQMSSCQLTAADKIGCYKNREIGFTGLCCKHCGGQPGFGRYFPATLRSLAQTTTSQTILKHITKKCRSVPTHVRQSVIELQSKDEEKAKAISVHETGRPRYGSRKVFFQRIWDRLHDDDGENSTGSSIIITTDLTKKPLKKQATTKRVVSTIPVQQDDDENHSHSLQTQKRRQRNNSRSGRLPLKKNIKKRRQQSINNGSNKRCRVAE